MRIELFTALTTGFLGSLHCIGMCGPICLSLPFNHSDPMKKFLSIILYNTGRILTYSILGLLIGIFGKGFELIGLQQVISIVSGVLIIAYIVFFPGFKIKFLPSGMLSSLKMKIHQLFQQKRWASMFFLGTLNGILPCGLVYVAIMGALATGEPSSGAEFMLFFGIGTLPAMISLPYASSYISKLASLKKLIPVAMTIIGLLLILRGMNLGIPYVSPEFQGHLKSSCCHH
jgi:sulfite exporter TauE/SafE